LFDQLALHPVDFRGCIRPCHNLYSFFQVIANAASFAASAR
jgi:hypothetical protein